jgi:hypothetical protein
MFEDIFPDKEVKRKTKRKNAKRKINLFPKGQAISGPTSKKVYIDADVGPDPAAKKPSKKAKKTMKRALAIRKYIKKGEKDKE